MTQNLSEQELKIGWFYLIYGKQSTMSDLYQSKLDTQF